MADPIVRRKKNSDVTKLALLGEILSKVQTISHSANGSTLLNQQTIQFTLSNLTQVGDSILTPNNTQISNTTIFLANFKCKVNISAAMHIDDNGNSASAGVHIFKNGTAIMVGTRTTDEVRGQCAAEVTLEQGQYLQVGLPIGIAVSGQPVYLAITAQRIYSKSEIEVALS